MNAPETQCSWLRLLEILINVKIVVYIHSCWCLLFVYIYFCSIVCVFKYTVYKSVALLQRKQFDECSWRRMFVPLSSWDRYKCKIHAGVCCCILFPFIFMILFVYFCLLVYHFLFMLVLVVILSSTIICKQVCLVALFCFCSFCL